MNKENNILSEETLKAIVELSEVLKGIHKRLLEEGYIIEGGRIYGPFKDLNDKKPPEQN